ncbi:MAG: hypothetical protein AAGI34_03825 [Pseudomonadota bacterium]
MRSVTLVALALLTACAPQDVRTTGTLAGVAQSAPAVALPRLALPARIGLVRLVDGRVSTIPASERTRWAGAAREINRNLIARLDLIPLPVPPLDVAAANSAANPGMPDPSAAVATLMETAARARLDAVLFYELAARVENDRALAAFADLPILGGIVPPAVQSEADAFALALLLDTRTRAFLGSASARVSDQPIARLRDGRGSPAAHLDAARYAALHALIPGAEDLITTAIASGF